MNRMEGVIFDFDGTLVDSMWVWEDLGRRYLESRGLIPEPDLSKKIGNMSMIQSAEYFRVHYGIHDSAEQIIQDINRLIEDFYKTEVLLKEGGFELVNGLSEKGVQMCILTASPSYMVNFVLEKFDLKDKFKAIISCNDYGFSKDSPAVFQFALKFLGTDIEKTIVVEDALYAAKAAKKAGFDVVGVFDASETNKMEMESISDIYLKSLDDWGNYYDL